MNEGISAMVKKLTLLVVATVVSACGPGGTFTGKVGGKELSVQDALFFPYKANGAVVGATIILADKPNVCTSLKSNRVPKNSAFVAMTLFRVTSNGSVVPPDTGDYTVTSTASPGVGNFAYTEFNSLDSNCVNLLPDTATGGVSGLVKVATYKPEVNGGMSGSFDMTFGSQNDKGSGSFNAAYCDLANNFPSAPNCE